MSHRPALKGSGLVPYILHAPQREHVPQKTHAAMSGCSYKIGARALQCLSGVWCGQFASDKGLKTSCLLMCRHDNL